MFSYLIVYVIGLLFYLVFPGIGAFLVRAKWRDFREGIINSSFFPLLDYAAFRRHPEGGFSNYRFFGTLEAIQENDIIWLRGQSVLVSVDMRKAPLYILESREGVKDDPSLSSMQEGSLTPLSWRQIFTLPEGTNVFITGQMRKENGMGVFQSSLDLPMTAILYEGPKDKLLSRVIWGGRQKNEYWNSITPGSLAVGFFSLLVLANYYLSVGLSAWAPVLTLTASLIPFSLLLPPGVLFYILYRRLWQKGRRLRAERDLLQLPLRYFRGQKSVDGLEASLPDGSTYRCEMLSLKKDGMVSMLDGAVLRTSGISLPLKDSRAYAFGQIQVNDGIVSMKKSSDPFAEYLIIPQNPYLLANHAHRKAMILEIISLLSMSFGLFINTYIVIAILQRVLY